MSKIFKPRRGIASVMRGSKAATVLSKGEFFMECPDTGVGTGKSKIKMGDGVTPYADLPYAIAGMDPDDPVELANKTYTDQTTALNDVRTGNSLKTVLNALKSAVKLNADSVSALNDDTNQKLPFRLGIVNGTYGYYQLNNTFKSFRQPTGNAGAAQVLQSSGANNTGTKYTASNASSDGFNGTMPNRGALNWSGSNTTATVAAGYYSGGTLDSRPSYNSGYNNGYSAGVNAASTMKYVKISDLESKGTANQLDAYTVSVGNRKYAGVIVYLKCATSDWHWCFVRITCSSGQIVIPASDGGQWGYYGGASCGVFANVAANSTIGFRAIDRNGSDFVSASQPDGGGSHKRDRNYYLGWLQYGAVYGLYS